jgi:hypothetical protein
MLVIYVTYVFVYIYINIILVIPIDKDIQPLKTKFGFSGSIVCFVFDFILEAEPMLRKVQE